MDVTRQLPIVSILAPTSNKNLATRRSLNIRINRRFFAALHVHLINVCLTFRCTQCLLNKPETALLWH